jgi:uncharacterized protein with ATP-grasp and redox domains
VKKSTILKASSAVKAQAECLKCIMDQAWRAGQIAGCTPEQHAELLRCVGAICAQTDLSCSPAVLSQGVYDELTRLTGNSDPYRDIKRDADRQALEVLPMVRERIATHADPLHAAIHVAAGGNLMDLGAGSSFDFRRDLDALLDTPLVVDVTGEFRRQLQPGATLLYVSDNAGEIAFDRLLIEQLLGRDIQVTLAVKAAPVINDATLEDAETVGLTDLVPVVTTGSNDLGVNFEHASAEFLKHFRQSHIQLLKGQANYESGDSETPNGFFLLKAKCAVVAKCLGVNTGDSVFAHPPAREPKVPSTTAKK